MITTRHYHAERIENERGWLIYASDAWENQRAYGAPLDAAETRAEALAKMRQLEAERKEGDS